MPPRADGPRLSTAFLLIAENALISRGHSSIVPAELERIAAFVAPVLTLDNLVHRERDLLAVALEDFERRRATENAEKPVHPEDEPFETWCRAMDRAIQIGLVAGYLIARMLDGQDDAR